MINSLRLLGRVERLFVSGLRKNIVALLVQCAVVGGVTLQGRSANSDAACPSQVINLAYCTRKLHLSTFWSWLPAPQLKQTKLKHPNRQEVISTTRLEDGWT